MTFAKQEVSKLNSQIKTFGIKQAELQSVLTQIIANVIYQSIAGSNSDPGIKLFVAMKENGYNRTNDTITYLCKMGNFKYSKKEGLQFKSNFPRTEEMAIEMAERAISNPMFTIVKEASVKTEADVRQMVKAMFANIKKWEKEALDAGKTFNLQHKEDLEVLKGLLPNA